MLRALLLATALVLTQQQQTPLSPCPNVFSYEPPGTEPGRWYGVVNLSTDSILHSVWINVVLDSKADILGNWVGDVTTTDNTDFKIENTKMKIHPGPATAVRFFVQYNPLNKAPKLRAIRLNGREICNANNPQPAIDRPDERRTTARPLRPDEARPVLRPDDSSRPVLRPDDSSRPVLRPDDIPQAKPVQGQQAGAGPVYSTTQGPPQNPVNLNIGGGQIPAQSVGTQTSFGTNPGTGPSFGTNTGTGPSFGSDTGSSSFGTNTGSSFGTQTGSINDDRRRPDNGYRLTTAVPMRTTTTSRYDDDDDGNDYFSGGQPTFIVPSRPNNNNNNFNNNNRQQTECGKVVRNNPNPLVVNGRPTLEGQWPWQIALYQTQTVDNKYICGGTLVTRSHVITAAHCVTRKGSSRVVNQNTLTVYLGKHNLRTSVEGVQIKLVSEIRVHPQYNASSYSRDVGVLKLRERVTYSDFVRPACLWPDNEVDLTNVIGKKGSVVGWGFDDKGVATEELTLVEMPVVDQETCIRSYSEFFARFTSDYTYCAGYKDGAVDKRTGTRKSSSVCNGDSGGGMVFLMRNSWYLRGLVSLSVARHNEYRCDPTHYVVFTDLAKFLPWIQQNTSDE
ncbi:serine proteinase stubble-like isoform X1 [Cydia amplana]|uniref:serine proteinase stubble-like isoform X1 n=1 Tax=Cydia amplana TaxID=1869771 RepID=UPI002FE6491F